MRSSNSRKSWQQNTWQQDRLYERSDSWYALLLAFKSVLIHMLIFGTQTQENKRCSTTIRAHKLSVKKAMYKLIGRRNSIDSSRAHVIWHERSTQTCLIRSRVEDSSTSVLSDNNVGNTITYQRGTRQTWPINVGMKDIAAIRTWLATWDVMTQNLGTWCLLVQ